MSVFFLAQKASWKMWLNFLLSVSCPLGCSSRCFSFFFSFFFIYEKKLQKDAVDSMNFAKLYFNWELYQVVEIL